MGGMRKAWVALLAACVLLAGCSVEDGPSYPQPTERFFVNDFADCLTDGDEQAVYEAGVKLQQATKAQVVLVTVDSLDGQTLEDYGIGLSRSWGIGDKELDNGILLLFTTDGPHSRIEVGYGLEGALPDSKAGRILDTYLVPGYSNESAWSGSLTDTYKALVNVVYGEYGLTEEQYPLADPQPVEEDDDLMLVLPFLLIFVLILLLGRRGGGFRGPFIGGFGGGFHGGFHGGGGGFRGGGGGFRGGGGGFGGGGASR